MSIETQLAWTFTAKCEPTPEILQILLDGEEVHLAYKTVRTSRS